MSKPNAVPNPYEGLSAEQALETMRQLSKDETRNHVLMGLLYNYLVDSKLLEGSDYKSPLDFICDNIQEISRTALLDYGLVARSFKQEVCTQYGLSRLRLLFSYKDAAKIEVNLEEPGGTFILVPDKQGEVQPKLFADCSVADMRQALQHLREATPATPFPPEDRALVDAYRAAVTQRFPRGSPVRVQLRKYKGESMMEFRLIPVAQANLLLEAMMDMVGKVPPVPAPQVLPKAVQRS
ncbi:MAG: hypothetical protein ACJ8AT_29910 [Hyalangium sp.]|uniref:hypothetical protein n=1 Tax=Hyalangium sp. TaxID=2028555 RepID=UPI003899D0D2